MANVRRTARSRPPAVAGQFYPAHPDRLRREVESLLAATMPVDQSVQKALIAPHAGYAYSGSVAAAAFSALHGRTSSPERAVVIGPAHYVAFEGIALPTVETFETPLGSVSLCREAVERLIDLPFVMLSDVPHAPEHALEVELPFLQCLLGPFELVPLLVGRADPVQVAQALNRLWSGPETLIVVSSDLSHFHDYETARRLDVATGEKIEAGRWSAIGPNDACGHLAIAGLLIEMEHRGLSARRLALCNSGDAGGSAKRVVGYGAWAW